MPDAGRQIWKIRVPRDVELTPLENRNEQEKNKDNEKRTKRNEKMKKMRDEWKDNEKWSFKKWSLVKIALKYNLGMFILSFKPWTLTYITYLKSSFWLNVDTWTEELFPWENCHNQQGYRFFSSAKILDKSFTCSEWLFKCIIGQSKNEKNCCINTNHFPYKESLFSLGSHVRDDKWPSFIILLL